MNLPVPTDDQRRAVLASRLRLRKALIDTLRRIQVDEKKPAFEEVVKAITSNKHRDWLAQSHDDDSLVSYARSSGVRFLPERRTKTTLARYIRRKWPDKEWINDRDLECFCNKAMSLIRSSDSLFRIISGSRITQAYRDEVGGHSCMTGDECDKVAIYEHNPGVVQMLVFDDGSMTARALILKTDQGKTAMDRIYPNSGRHIELFNKYARDRGWLVRDGNRMPQGDVTFTDEDGDECGELTVSLDLPDQVIYPYMDSFRWVKDYDGDSVVLSMKYTRGRHCLDSTGGEGPGSESNNYMECRDCGCRVDPGDSYTDDNGYDYCSDCYNERYGICERCNRETARDDLALVYTARCAYATGWCSDCRCSHAIECEGCGELFSIAIGRISVVDGEHYCDDCESSHTECCHECSETHLTENMEQDDDGDWYCEGCLPEPEEEEDDAGETADEEATAVVAAV